MNSKKIIFTLSLAMIVCAMGCQKDYYKDTGIHKGDFNGTVLDYLNSKPDYFTTVVKLIKMTGMESAFQNEDITFFAPADSSINLAIAFLNSQTQFLGLPKVTRVEQISTDVWRKYLSRYVFKGKKAMNDYRQFDPENLSAYSGQIYASYDGSLMNVGVLYYDAGGVKYAGYRQLYISFIPSSSSPLDYTTWYSAQVASANIAPTNGYVHVLRYANHSFGFNPILFFQDAVAAGIQP